MKGNFERIFKLNSIIPRNKFNISQIYLRNIHSNAKCSKVNDIKNLNREKIKLEEFIVDSSLNKKDDNFCSPTQTLEKPKQKVSMIKDLKEITKFKLSILNTIVSLSTFTLIGNPTIMQTLFFGLGTMSISMTTQVLNQIKEKFFDSQMMRTHTRPLPKERFSIKQAAGIAAFLELSSLAFFSVLPFGTQAMIFSNFILFLYISVYTPLKRKNNLSMHVGAVVGALPPLLGSIAGGNPFSPEALLLAGFIFAWQYPHFYGILYPNRYDYQKAGFKFIAVDESKDSIAHKQMILGMIGMALIVYILYKRKIISNLGLFAFLATFAYQIPAVMNFQQNPLKYGKIIRIRSYIPFLIVLGCFFKLSGKAILENKNKDKSE